MQKVGFVHRTAYDAIRYDLLYLYQTQQFVFFDDNGNWHPLDLSEYSMDVREGKKLDVTLTNQTPTEIENKGFIQNIKVLVIN